MYVEGLQRWSGKLQPTRLMPQQLEEKREKGLCFNYDDKYNTRHNSSVRKLLYIDFEEEEDPKLRQSEEVDLE